MVNQKKIFLAYKFTGEDIRELNETLGKIIAILRSSGHTVYCSIEDEDWFRKDNRTNREILGHALEQLNASDLMLAFIRSDEKSEGMILEIGYLMAKGKPFVLALQKGIKTTFIKELATSFVEFDSVDDLCDKLKKFEF